jgi:hypothetical protein
MPVGAKHARYFAQPEEGQMHSAAAEPPVSHKVAAELASAVKDYCSAVSAMADAARCGVGLSPQAIGRAVEARLRLENARTYFELCVCRRAAGRRAASEPRRIH